MSMVMTKASQYVTATIPALAILGFFVWFANWIPQTRWEAPKAQQISSNMAPAQLSTVGETIARQRGCLACHTIEPGAGVKGGGRGPNWADIASRRAQGVPGGPGNLVEYLTQSLYEPGAYLVEGYANIMPAAINPPAKLSYEEVVAVIDYLQSLGGKPAVKIGDIPRPPAGAGTAAGQPGASGGAALAEPAAMMDGFGCAACHSPKAGETRVGPSLDPGDLRQTAAQRGTSPEAYVMESIVKPAAYEKEGFPKGVMPPDFGTKLTAAQLEALVMYLLSASR